MLESYLTAIFRRFSKDRVFATINTLGLALGITCFTIILLFVEREFSYDRFHHNPENVYRIVKDFVNNDGTRIPDATTPPALTTVIRQELPEVESITRFFPNRGRHNLFIYGEKKFYEMNMLRIDEHFFDVFDFQFIHGSKDRPFNGTHSVVLTETTARKYFGNENPVGKIIRTNINNSTDFEVSGVVTDVPGTSHFNFDVLVPFESGRNPDVDWEWYGFYTYARLKPGTAKEHFETNVQNLFKKHQPNSLNAFYIQPLTDIHLNSNLKWELSKNGDISYVNILILIGAFVMLIAGINYVNLATARSAKRSREVGIRKVNGAFRSLLIRQFLFESIIMVLISFSFSIIITALILPLAKPVTGSDLSVFVMESRWVRTILPCSVLMVGIFAGFYPAFYLSSFQPLRVLRGNFFGMPQGMNLRQGLVVIQFIISTVLIVGSLVIVSQLDFMRNKKLGFDQENVIMLPNIRGSAGNERANAVPLEHDLKTIHSVKSVARADGIFGFMNAMNGVASKQTRTHISLNFVRADYSFIPTLGIEVIEGRNFSPEFPSDSSAIILNEKAVAQLGLRKPVVGQQLEWDDENGRVYVVTVVGVVRDFHFSSFHQEIKPFGFILEVNNGSTFFVKVDPRNIGVTLKTIEKVWLERTPNRPFDYSFQDEQMAKLHIAEERFQRLFSWFTFLAIVIACLGLFGLVTATAESKTKEIGIRKVLGSSVAEIVGLLSKQFIKLVIVAMVIAMPLSWFVSSYWLQGFAYRIDIGWKVLTAAGVAILLIAILTVCFQSIKAALANPVNSLRSE